MSSHCPPSCLWSLVICLVFRSSNACVVCGNFLSLWWQFKIWSYNVSVRSPWTFANGWKASSLSSQATAFGQVLWISDVWPLCSSWKVCKLHLSTILVVVTQATSLNNWNINGPKLSKWLVHFTPQSLFFLFFSCQSLKVNKSLKKKEKEKEKKNTEVIMSLPYWASFSGSPLPLGPALMGSDSPVCSHLTFLPTQGIPCSNPS